MAVENHAHEGTSDRGKSCRLYVLTFRAVAAFLTPAASRPGKTTIRSRLPRRCPMPSRAALVCFTFLIGIAAWAADKRPAYFTCPVSKLEIIEGTLPLPRYGNLGVP